MSGNSEKQAQQQLGRSQLDLAQKQDSRSDKLFDLALPGMQKAEDFYSKMASGDPDLLAKSVAPAAEQITQQGNQAKQAIRAQNSRGGEERLAEDMTDASTAGAKGRLTTSSFLNSFNALAGLGTTNIGLSNNQVSNAISGMSSAGQTYGNIAQADAANKAATLGFAGSLAGAAGSVGAAFA